MASSERRREENVPGDFLVDASCIDCDTCRWMAPETFGRAGGQSHVHEQPGGVEAERRALLALVSCPTASIGTGATHAMKPVFRDLPLPIEDEVGHCGFHHESSFGAASYLIQRPAAAGGNVLVDSPRFAGPLVRRLEELGGIATMFLTHRDDVGDHERFRSHFGCERILHVGDASDELRGLELLVEGDEPIELDDDLTLIPTPGHTLGSACLLYRERFLFTGDHAAWSADMQQVYAFRSACWHDWGVQVESMQRLADHSFAWLLPGHGRRCRLEPARVGAEIGRAVTWMRAHPA